MEVKNCLPWFCTICERGYMNNPSFTIVTSCFACYEEQAKQDFDKLGKEKLQENCLTNQKSVSVDAQLEEVCQQLLPKNHLNNILL